MTIIDVAYNRKYLATASDTRLKIWDLKTQALLHTFENAHSSNEK